jgi:Ca2+-binding EF-hand superfamily protein
MPLNYKDFFIKVQNNFINHELTGEELCDSAKQFAFNLYDMNFDGFIESNDLFSFIKDVNSDEVLYQACYQDIQDI